MLHPVAHYLAAIAKSRVRARLPSGCVSQALPLLFAWQTAARKRLVIATKNNAHAMLKKQRFPTLHIQAD